MAHEILENQQNVFRAYKKAIKKFLKMIDGTAKFYFAFLHG